MNIEHEAIDFVFLECMMKKNTKIKFKKKKIIIIKDVPIEWGKKKLKKKKAKTKL